MICARRGSPLAIGYGDGEMFIGSDSLALAPLTRRITYLEEGDWAVVTSREVHDLRPRQPEGRARGARDGAVRRADRQGQLPPFHAEGDLRAAGGDRRHLAGAGQPGDPQRASAGSAVRARRYRQDHDDRLRHRAPRRHDREILARTHRPHPGRRPMSPRNSATARRRCRGTARRWSSRNRARPPTRWRRCAIAARQGQKIIAIVNQPESTIAREADVVLPTLAGPEIGVASTKAFTTQLAVLAAFTVAMARARGTIDAETARRRWPGSSPKSRRAPARCCTTTSGCGRSPRRSRRPATCSISGAARPIPLALEGALKLKEISYIHAEGYAAGEMKHGPIALIDENVPVIVLAPPDDLFDKTLSNVEEIMARGGRVVMISDAAGVARLEGRLRLRHRGAALRPVRRAAALRDPDPAARLPRRGAERHRRRPAPQPGEKRHGGVARG